MHDYQSIRSNLFYYCTTRSGWLSNSGRLRMTTIATLIDLMKEVCKFCEPIVNYGNTWENII